MTDEQYIDTMLKIAYAAGCEVARQEKEAAGPALPRPQIPAGANQPQARKRGENPAGSAQLNRMAGGALPARPTTSYQQPGPKMTVQGRTPGVALRNQQQQSGRSVASQ
jgi:hypothetical protein